MVREGAYSRPRPGKWDPGPTMSVTARQIHRLPSALDAPLARLSESSAEITKAWVLAVLDRAPLSEIERMPMEQVAGELPELVAQLLASLAEDERATAFASDAEACERIALLVGFRGRTCPSFAEVSQDLAALQSVLTAALHAELEKLYGDSLLDALRRLTRVFAVVAGAAGERLMEARSRELEQLASSDPLTGLYNRRHLWRQIEHLTAVHRRYGHPFSAVVFDVVGLKAINDSYGHSAGDDALVAVARAAEATVRTVDTTVRLSGDEFGILAPNQTATEAALLGGRLLSAVDRLDGPGGAPLAISVGVASCPEHTEKGSELLRMADLAMYRARAAGDRVGVADAPQPTAERQAAAAE